MSISSAVASTRSSPLSAGAGHVPVSPAERHRSPASEELEFARRLRSSAWKSLTPLIATLLFGAALLFTAVAEPASSIVQRMLTAEREEASAAAHSAILAAGTDYVLPQHWQVPGAASQAVLDTALACDPSQSGAQC